MDKKFKELSRLFADWANKDVTNLFGDDSGTVDERAEYWEVCYSWYWGGWALLHGVHHFRQVAHEIQIAIVEDMRDEWEIARDYFGRC